MIRNTYGTKSGSGMTTTLDTSLSNKENMLSPTKQQQYVTAPPMTCGLPSEQLLNHIQTLTIEQVDRLIRNLTRILDTRGTISGEGVRVNVSDAAAAAEIQNQRNVCRQTIRVALARMLQEIMQQSNEISALPNMKLDYSSQNRFYEKVLDAWKIKPIFLDPRLFDSPEDRDAMSVVENWRLAKTLFCGLCVRATKAYRPLIRELLSFNYMTTVSSTPNIEGDQDQIVCASNVGSTENKNETQYCSMTFQDVLHLETQWLLFNPNNTMFEGEDVDRRDTKSIEVITTLGGLSRSVSSDFNKSGVTGRMRVPLNIFSFNVWGDSMTERILEISASGFVSLPQREGISNRIYITPLNQYYTFQQSSSVNTLQQVQHFITLPQHYDSDPMLQYSDLQSLFLTPIFRNPLDEVPYRSTSIQYLGQILSTRFRLKPDVRDATLWFPHPIPIQDYPESEWYGVDTFDAGPGASPLFFQDIPTNRGFRFSDLYYYMQVDHDTSHNQFSDTGAHIPPTLYTIESCNVVDRERERTLIPTTTHLTERDDVWYTRTLDTATSIEIPIHAAIVLDYTHYQQFFNRLVSRFNIVNHTTNLNEGGDNPQNTLSMHVFKLLWQVFVDKLEILLDILEADAEMSDTLIQNMHRTAHYIQERAQQASSFTTTQQQEGVFIYKDFIYDLSALLQYQSNVEMSDIPRLLFSDLFQISLELPILTSSNLVQQQQQHTWEYERLLNYYSNQAFQLSIDQGFVIQNYIVPLFGSRDSMGNDNSERILSLWQWPSLTCNHLLCLSRARNAVDMLPNLLSLSLEL